MRDLHPYAKVRLVLLAGLLGALAAAPAAAQESLAAPAAWQALQKAQGQREPAGLRQAAESGLRSWLGQLQQNWQVGTLPANFPLEVTDASQFSELRLGLAFELHSASPQQLLASNGQPLAKRVQGNGVWQVLVMLDKHAVGMLEMAKRNHQWQIEGIGGAGLAKDVMQAAQNHAGVKPFRFVRIYQATSDLLEVQDKANQARYVPLIAARESLHLTAPLAREAALPGDSEILPALQDAVRKHVNQFSGQQ